MIIPVSELNKDTLYNIAKEFVLREGTDYGEVETDLATKVEQVVEQLTSGEAVLVYSELHETVDIRPARDYSEDN